MPDVVSDADVKKAVWWFQQAVYDMPFSDRFGDAAELEPIYELDPDTGLECRTADGHRVPNFRRGEASRAHLIVLCLQPFVRNMIKGNCPAYHFDKPKAGTGATLLSHVPGFIALGEEMPVTRLGKDTDEIAKSIGASLQTAGAYLFLDNINFKVDSGELAALITSNDYNTRRLGTSENIRIKSRTAIIFAGNKLEFSSELLRRIIPIRLDAACEHPDRERSGYRYADFLGFLREHRADLVWAAHVLVRNWIQNDRRDGSVRFEPFPQWAAVMGGILEAAAVPGFLANLAAYRGAGSQEEVSKHAFVEALWHKFKDGPFTTREAYEGLQHPHFGWPYEYMELPPPIGGHDKEAVKKLGRYIRKDVASIPYKVELENTGPAELVVIQATMENGNARWQLVKKDARPLV